MIRILVVAMIASACGGGPRQSGAPAQPAPPAPPTAPAAEPYALAVVMSGWELWIGNDELAQIKPDDPSRTEGALKPIKAALAEADLAHTAPPGSLATVITYDDKVKIRLPLGPIAELAPETLGTQQDYFGTVGVELVAAVGKAIDALAQAPTKQRYLVVLGDGGDTNSELARQVFAKLKPELAANGIEAIGLVLKAKDSLEDTPLGLLIDDTLEISTYESYQHMLARRLRGLGK